MNGVSLRLASMLKTVQLEPLFPHLDDLPPKPFSPEVATSSVMTNPLKLTMTFAPAPMIATLSMLSSESRHIFLFIFSFFGLAFPVTNQLSRV